MKNKIFALLLSTLIFAAASHAQQSGIVPANLSRSQIDDIVKKFTERESLFREALGNYSFDRSAVIRTIGMGGQFTGEYRRDSTLTFTSSGERFERIKFAPVSTLTEIEVTAADIENMGGIDPFAIEPRQASKYNFTLLGKEAIDEIDTYVFEVTPKVVPQFKKGVERLFSGRVWVEDRDYNIVKTKGKAVPEGDERFPMMETWRENVDGKYWFPAYISSNDELVFKSGQVVKMWVRVKYNKYAVGRTDVRVVEEEDAPADKVPPAEKKAEPPAKKP